jgi:transcriptional regulator with XRE-family HTH domain
MKNGRAVKKIAAPPFPLAQVLDRLGVTLAGLSERSGVPYTTLAALARGASKPDWGTLVAIARGLDVPLCHFTPHRTREVQHVGYE